MEDGLWTGKSSRLRVWVCFISANVRMDRSQAAILVLLELREHCPEVFEKLEVYVDGGFERGSDILKAIALGATAVGIGRPFLYSLVYGQEGVEHLSQSMYPQPSYSTTICSDQLLTLSIVLKDELETSMRLCGITSLDEATPDLVNTLDVDYMVVPKKGSTPKVPRRRRLAAKL